MAKSLPRSLSVRPVKLQGELEETFYKKSDDGKRYRHAGSSDLWLVETKDGRRATLAIPRRGQGWMVDRGTTWLTNSPSEGKPMASKKRRAKRPVPRGYSSWKQYMAAIRPNSPKRKVKRMAAKSKKRARPRTAVVLVNSPKKRRGVRRRNPDLGAYVSSAVTKVMHGAIGGGVIVGTELGTRYVRKRVFGMSAGTAAAAVTELAISSTAGVAAEYVLPASIAARTSQLIVDAGFASVYRSVLKQMAPQAVADVLGDDGPRRVFVVRNGQVVRRADAMGSYVGGPAPVAARLNGYVAGGRRQALGQYVAGGAGASNNAALEAAALDSFGGRGQS